MERWCGDVSLTSDSSWQILAALPVEISVPVASICASYVGARSTSEQCYGGLGPLEKCEKEYFLVFKITETQELT